MLAKILPWVSMAVLDIAAPIVVYDVASGAGLGDVPALLLSAIGPALSTLLSIAVRGRVDEFSVFILTLLAIGVLTSLLFDDPRLLLLKESAVTGLVGLVFLGSLLAPRPVMFLFGRRFATNGDPERIAWWNGLWQLEGFRRTQRGMTAMWGLGLLAEAVVRIVLTYRLSVPTMVVVNAVVPAVVLGVLIVATVLWGRASARAGAARAAAAAAGEGDGTPVARPA
ncbi:VC0807 family protein [Actinomycetospora termitidis]|uniref:VC0807 family protein n=1 Tax=Actinomycetospora termitidis TaxID=3053470 RepID=A0ABT7MDV6_9PSEU|nr:VC0807 family protein [Actinomycetospora sp. Odt1-22]MDL5158851.1 VC0807 family protein [Actinomycetospora sp. Odt1-22]